MLHVAVEWSRAAEIRQVRAVYVPTAKNVPCKSFFQKSELSVQAENEFIWDTAQAYLLDGAIRLVRDGGAFEKPSIRVNPSEFDYAINTRSEIKSDLTHG